MKHYLTQPSDPCEQEYTDEEIDQINDDMDAYYEGLADDKRYDEKD